MQGPGAVAANLYQGIRSEYLAQYVFSMFGTVTRVPNEEDHGVDLVCTLTRRAGGRAEPFAYYSVQVKSAPGDWSSAAPAQCGGSWSTRRRFFSAPPRRRLPASPCTS